MKTRLMLILLLVGALVLSACQPGAQPITSGGNTPAPSTSGKTPQPIATKAPVTAPTQAPSDNTSSGNIDLTDISQGLETLNSYQTNFTMSFDGTEDNKPKQWNWTTLEEFVKDPAAKHSKMSSSNTGTTDTAFESWEVNGKSFVLFGDTCMQSDSNSTPTASSSFTPASIIGDIKGAQLLGAETVNGVPTQHFAVDVQRFAALGAYTDGKSEVWVATPGNYVVKYFFQATGKDAFFASGTNTQGTIRWDYEVKNINQPINIAPPDTCGKTATDIPILPDAKNNSIMGDLTMYSSATAFNDAVTFYKTQMVAQGWTEDASGGMSADGFASLSFKKDTRTASINITFDKDKNETSVMISISK